MQPTFTIAPREPTILFEGACQEDYNLFSTSYCGDCGCTKQEVFEVQALCRFAGYQLAWPQLFSRGCRMLPLRSDRVQICVFPAGEPRRYDVARVAAIGIDDERDAKRNGD